MNVREYVMIEVWRQGYFPTEYVYQLRVNGMVDAMRWAKRRANWPGHEKPTLEDVMLISKEIEPCNTGHSWRHVNVQIGSGFGAKLFPRNGDVPYLMERLWQFIDDATPEEFYKQFEEIHPLEDGNGRTGKVIYNWLKHTLDEPIFPPNFFGGNVP